MSAIFADTFYFLAMLSPKDARHADVLAFSHANRRPIITTTWVLAELGNGLSRSAQRSQLATLVANLRGDPFTTIVPATDKWFEKGLALFSSRRDKEWSMVDCISFAVMQESGLLEALTADHHFEQAGFRKLF